MAMYVGVPMQEETEEANNRVLALHRNLTRSLYKERGEEYVSKSCIIVIAATAVVCFLSYWQDISDSKTYVYYLTLSWIFPTVLYFIGISQHYPCLLLPWIIVAGVHVIGLIIALFTLAVHMDERYCLVGIFFLVLALLLPAILSIPVKAFIFMDSERGEAGLGCCEMPGVQICPGFKRCVKRCCQAVRVKLSSKRRNRSRMRAARQRAEGAAIMELSVVTDNAATNGQCQQQQLGNNRTQHHVEGQQVLAPGGDILRDHPQLGSLMSPSHQFLSDTELGLEMGAHPLLLEETDGDLPAYDDVVDDDDDEGGADGGRYPETEDADPPPSYSVAEGLDQLPAYRDTGVNRARIGSYIFIYDKNNAKFKTFKK